MAVPLDYPVPSSGELVPLMVRATVDGTSAASSFYAVVQIIAPSGQIMGSALSGSIAAGASADVTWFPRVATGSGDGIKFDQPNTDPQGDSGFLAIDTGLIKIGDVIPADWEVVAVDYQFISTGTSGYDFEVSGGQFLVSAFDAGGNPGSVVLSGESGATLRSGDTELGMNSGGVYQLSATLPTSDPGILNNLWNDGGILAISGSSGFSLPSGATVNGGSA